jgi:HAD superfamily phosphoserine phosphatase-like hydrolase
MKPTRIEISLDRQTLVLLADETPVRTFPISSGEKGMGFTEGSFRTPTGRFAISEKIGDGEPLNTRFDARVPVGIWNPEHPPADDLILTRIIRLAGLYPENANTMDRYIYIHGTNREDQIGTPASHGCIRLGNRDMIELFDTVMEGMEVGIIPLTGSRTKLLFLDCDSTLSSIEGIDELARFSNPGVFSEVVSLTNAAMDGKVPLCDVFGKRMEIIRPNRETAGKVSQCYVENIVPGAEELIAMAKENGWLPIILSGGFAPLIAPLARRLGIRHVEAVPLHFNDSGDYAGYGEDYPTTRNLGKNEIIREWRKAMLPERVIMIGDGVSDLETKPDVDVMVGFGGVVSREKVKAGADIWLTDFINSTGLAKLLGS